MSLILEITCVHTTVIMSISKIHARLSLKPFKNIKYVEKRKIVKPGSSLKNTRLLRWAKQNLIHPLTQRNSSQSKLLKLIPKLFYRLRRGNEKIYSTWTMLALDTWQEKKYFLSLVAYQGGSVEFENSKKGDIIGKDKLCIFHSHAIENLYILRSKIQLNERVSNV